MDLLPLPDDAPPRLLVGVSGGRDSTALLHRLAAWCMAQGRALRAIHVDHGLHPDATRWAAQATASAAALGVPLVVRRVRVEPGGDGPEAAARRARWAAYAAERHADECLVLAHHRDDQAETLLLALLRGAGERGLAAMRPFVRDARGPVWRPLLATPGDAIAAYASRHRLTWIDDPTNADTAFARNALRHEVLPLLRRRWRQADAALATSAALLAEADALLADQAQADLAPLLGLDAGALDASGLRALPPARARRALRAWAALNGAALTRDAMHRVFGAWEDAPPGRVLRHALGDHWLHQWQGRLWLGPRGPAPSDDAAPDVPACGAWDGRTPLALPDGGSIHLLGAPRLDAPLRAVPRARAPAKLEAPPGRAARSLQSVFASLGVPPWRRGAVPLLVDDTGRLAAVGDLAYAPGLDAWLRACGARLRWTPGPG